MSTVRDRDGNPCYESEPVARFTSKCAFCKQISGSNKDCASCREFASFLNECKRWFGKLTYVRTEETVETDREGVHLNTKRSVTFTNDSKEKVL